MGLRPMTMEDVPRVALIDAESYPFPWTVGNFADALSAGNRCCVYEERGELLAYAVLMMVVDELHLLNLTVIPAQQHLGYGRALLQRMLACARMEGFLTMWLEVRPSNVAARSLYDSMGFSVVGVRKQYYPACEGREDALLMYRDVAR